MRTRGEVHIKHEHVVKRAEDDRMIAVCGNHTNNRDDYRTWEENIHNAEFIAMCFNTADALDEAGYDGDAAIRELPEIVKILEVMTCSLHTATNTVTRVALDKIRGDK